MVASLPSRYNANIRSFAVRGKRDESLGKSALDDFGRLTIATSSPFDTNRCRVLLPLHVELEHLSVARTGTGREKEREISFALTIEENVDLPR